MDFSYSEDRQMVADILARYVQQRYPMETRHRISGSGMGWSPDHWAALAEMGIAGMLFAPADGGFGGGGFDIALVFEKIGHGLIVEPFLGVLMAGHALVLAGGQEELVGEVIGGTKLLAFAHEEADSRYDPAAISCVARKAGGDWVLTGGKAVVSQIEAADKIVVSARISGSAGEAAGIGLFLVEAGCAGLSVRAYPMIDGGRGGELALAGARATLLSDNGFAIIEQAIAAGTVALCWEAIGIMDELKAQTLEYLRTRTQFGAPIGKFQALQHRMATVALEIEQARSAAINAAAALESDHAVRERAVSAAKYTIGRVGTLVAEEAIQLHGGIGMTWELPLSHYAKRLTMIGHQLGDEDYHLERFASLGRAVA